MDDIEKRRSDRWNFLFIAGMWFQDLFNYDFRRTEMCIIPYGTQEGEISFCAYNTGIGWRNIIENMHMNATVTKWYEEHGRHEIFAGGKGSRSHRASITSSSTRRRLPRASKRPRRGGHREERTGREALARAAKNGGSQSLENERMMQLYRKHVLKDPDADAPVVQIQGLRKNKDKDTVVTH